MTKFTYNDEVPVPGGSGEKVDYTPLHDKMLTLQFKGFRLDDRGDLWFERVLEFGYTESGGKVFKKDDLSQIHPDDVPKFYVKRCRMLLQVIQPLTHYELSLSLPLTIKGFTISKGNSFRFWPEPTTGMMDTVVACGFNWRLANSASDYHDANYVTEKLEANCVSPLTEEQFVLGLFDPILREAADNGHLVEGHTKPAGAWLKWRQSQGFLEPITDKLILDKIWRSVEELPKGTPEPEPIPFIEDSPELVVVGGLTVADMKDAIALAVQGVRDSVLTGDTDTVRLTGVERLIQVIEPGFQGGAGMLSRMKQENLPALYAAVFPPAEETTSL